MIYFDSAGSFPVLAEVKSSLLKSIKTHIANPSADHALGLSANEEIEKVREQVADMIGALPSEIVFTSGATESNNLGIKGLLSTRKAENKKHIITSKIEHKCVLSICNYLASQGYEITYLSPKSDGTICPDDVKRSICADTALVSIMHVNNELGSINPLREIGNICFEKEVLFHTDAAQSFGKTEIDVEEMELDSLSLSAHKIGGMKGIGAIYLRDARDINITPVIHGAGQELGIRGGTVAAPLVISLGTACQYFPTQYSKANFEQLKQQLYTELERKNIEYFVNGSNGLPHIASISFPNTDIPTFVMANQDKFALAQGSACSSKEIQSAPMM